MNNTASYKIDYETKTITITKKFQKEASDIHSEAYRTMRQLMMDYPTFVVRCKEIKIKNGKQTYKGLTADEMRRFLTETYGKDSKEVTMLEKVIDISKARKGSFAVVKKWFLDNYKDEYNKELEAVNKKSETAEIVENADQNKSSEAA